MSTEPIIKPVPGVPNCFARSDGVIMSTARGWRKRELKRTIRGSSACVKVQDFRGRGRWSPTAASLVLLAFVGEPPTPKHRALHINCNSLDDSATNLRWATPREIFAHRCHFALESFEGEGALKDLATIARRLRSGEDRLVIAREYKIAPGCLNWLASTLSLLAFQRIKTRAT